METSRRQPAAAPDRSLSESELLHSEQRFRALVQHASDLLVVWDGEGTITYASPSTTRFVFGPDADDTRDVRRAGMRLEPDDLESVEKRVSVIDVTPGASDTFRVRALHHDGTRHWLEVTVINLLEDPTVGGMVASARDITDTVEFEEALRRNEERFRALVQHSSEIISVVDTDGTLLYASPAMESVLGYPEHVIAGSNAADILHPDDMDRAISLFARLVEHPERSVREVLRLRHADGSYRSIEVAATNRLDDPAIQGIIVNNHDVTERQEAAEARLASERWFRGLVQQGYDIIVVADADGTTRYVSPSIQHVLGYDPDDAIGDIGAAFMHPDDVPAMAKFFAAVTSTPGFQAPVELRARHADGSWHWFEAVYTNQLDDPVIRGIVMNFRDITERKEIEQQLSHQALHDALTGLPNRVLLTDRMSQALARAERTDTSIGVVFLDLDRFKLVNDTRGHAAGDALLAAIANRLVEATRATDTVARFGGDEFVVIYERVESVDELLGLSERLCAILAAPFTIDDEEVFVTVSAGAAVSEHGSEPDALLRDADAAMYYAKERGGGIVAEFDESIGRRAHTRYETERALRRALEHDELTIAYQPIVELDSGRIIATEALLRWAHPELGLTPPGGFIELAEQTGLVVPIGFQTLERAARQAVEWQGTVPQLEISVNVSAVQLRDPAFATVVSQTLDRVGLDPSSLMLEITESFLLDHTDICLDTLRKLDSLGICLALDDFGTRYSSLGYLNSIPVRALKIDRSFVEHLGTNDGKTAIVSAIVAMAKSLGLAVIAEGVETAQQHQELVELGCRFGQGHLYAAPMSVDDATAVVNQRLLAPDVD